MLVMNVTVGIAGILMIAIAGLPSPASAGYVIASGLIHLAYNALLVRMYRSGDLGETYPVARGSSPALVALGASLFAGEWMNAIAAAGIGLCVYRHLHAGGREGTLPSHGSAVGPDHGP